MCQPIRDQGCHFVFPIGPSFVELPSAVSEEKSKKYQPIRGQGGHLVFPIGPKNTNLVEDVGILLPVKFRSAFAEEKSKKSKRGGGCKTNGCII